MSCIAHLSAEGMLKSAVIEEKEIKHSPWAWADNPSEPKFWCQQDGLITMVTCCKFKTNLFNLWLYTYLFNDLINVYSSRSGADNPRGQNFDVNRNLLSLRSFATSFKKNFFEVWFYTSCFMILYIYIAPGQGLTPLGDEILMSTGTSCHFGHLLQVSKKSLWSLILYNFFMMLYMNIAPRQGQTAPRGQNIDVNRKALSLYPFVASFKEISLKSDFTHFFFFMI